MSKVIYEETIVGVNGFPMTIAFSGGFIKWKVGNPKTELVVGTYRRHLDRLGYRAEMRVSGWSSYYIFPSNKRGLSLILKDIAPRIRNFIMFNGQEEHDWYLKLSQDRG